MKKITLFIGMLLIAAPINHINAEAAGINKKPVTAACKCSPCKCDPCTCGTQCKCCASPQECASCSCECTSGKSCVCTSKKDACCSKNRS